MSFEVFKCKLARKSLVIWLFLEIKSADAGIYIQGKIPKITPYSGAPLFPLESVIDPRVLDFGWLGERSDLDLDFFLSLINHFFGRKMRGDVCPIPVWLTESLGCLDPCS
jgi:hypothetical protein